MKQRNGPDKRGQRPNVGTGESGGYVEQDVPPECGSFLRRGGGLGGGVWVQHTGGGVRVGCTLLPLLVLPRVGVWGRVFSCGS